MSAFYKILSVCATTLLAGGVVRAVPAVQNPEPPTQKYENNVGQEPAEENEQNVENDAAAQPAPVYNGAHLAFGGNVYDFGDVARRGGDVSTEFEFVNDGTEPLVVTGVTISCTCIKAVYSKRPVGVGKRGTVKLIYEPHKMEPGTFYKVVQVHSNSVGGDCLLTVRGNSVDVRKIK